MKSSSGFRDARIEFPPISQRSDRDVARTANSVAYRAGASGEFEATGKSDHGEFNESIVSEIPFWKRVLDLTVIALSLPVWLLLMVIVTAWIKIGSPGPIFYRQERVGYRGKRFMVLKFRSMKVNAETEAHERHVEQLIRSDRPMIKLDAIGDARVIPFGRFLRASGLDELPQIFNVIRGEMSLVGPRPCTPHEFMRYEARHRERVNAPPGVTGYWQVHGKNKTTFSEMIEMDIYYGENMSVGLDCLIIVKTLPAIFIQVLESRPSDPAQDLSRRILKKAEEL